MKIVGITGGIASGKSTISEYLRKNYIVIDADEISRSITLKNQLGYEKLLSEFGYEILDDDENIDRKKLASIVFPDKQKLNKLNYILHPIIFDEIDRKIMINNGEKIVFLDAPLLFETNLYEKCEYVILVHCDEKIQLERIIKRDNRNEKSAIDIIKSQKQVFEKIKKSEYIIENDKSIELLYDKIDIVLEMMDI